MGPIALFDKSFLQSLSLDESIWFDKFFIPVICPIFYVETLADLAKEPTNRTAEEAVRIIAEKTPEMSGSPCAFHEEMALQNMLGHGVPMDGRIPRTGARPVRGGGRTGVVYNVSQEIEAFCRWQDGKFLELERSFAADWRQSLAEADLTIIAQGFRAAGLRGKNCASLERAREIAAGIVNSRDDALNQMATAGQFLNVPQPLQKQIIENWRDRGRPEFSAFAPYATYVLTVEMFFHLAIAASLISAERRSNRTDIAYLFYLPFCSVFISNDKLHRHAAKLFLRSDQEFVWGPALKKDLKRLNAHYSDFPEDVRNEGVLGIATHPPVDGDFLTTALWHRLMGKTAFSQARNDDDLPTKEFAEVPENLQAFVRGQTLPDSMSLNSDDIEAMAIERRIHRRKGSWYLVPKNLPDPDNA